MCGTQFTISGLMQLSFHRPEITVYYVNYHLKFRNHILLKYIEQKRFGNTSVTPKRKRKLLKRNEKS